MRHDHDMRRRKLLHLIAAATAGFALPGRGRAQQGAPYPSRPIRYLMPFAAGGGPDLLARTQAPELSRELGVPVVVENRAGAGGIVAGEAVASAPADGYTVTLGSSAHVINKLMKPSIGFDPVKSFDPVSLCWTSATILVVPERSELKTPKQLVEAIRARPGTMNHASGGVGTAAHLAGGAFASVLGLKVEHVPYRGSVEIVPALIKGEVQFAFPIASTALPAIRDGRVRALAVTSRSRIPQLPDTPTLVELYGNELLVQEAWGGLWLPRGAPANVIERLFDANERSLRSQHVRDFYLANGTAVVTSASPSAFAVYTAEELGRWARILDALHLKPA